MFSRILNYLTIGTVVFASYTAGVFASTSNGVTTVPGNGPEVNGIAYFYRNYTLTSTATVYNDSGSSTATDGWVSINGSSNRIIQYNITNITGTVTLTFYGKATSDASEGTIAEVVSSGTATGFIDIVEHLDQMRTAAVMSTGTSKIKVIGKFTGITFAP